MKLILLVNPIASSVTPTSQVLVAKMLSKQHDVEILLTDGKGHATDLAEQATKSDAEVLIVYGGDGTLNEVANGLVGSDLVLGVLPGGSTNVFSRIIGLDDDPIVATEQVLNGLRHKNISKIGVGEVNDRIFLFHAGIGFDAQVVQKVEGRAEIKRWVAHLFFIFTAVTTWLWRYDKQNPHFTLDFEGEEVNGFFTVCMNANPYTYIGSRPLHLGPLRRFNIRSKKDTSFNENLVVVTATSLEASDIFRFVFKSISRNKSLKGDPSIDFRGGEKSFRVHFPKEFPYQADGDFLGHTSELHFRHRPDSLNLLFPPKL